MSGAPPYLLYVIIQSQDPEGGGEAGIGRDGGADRRRLANVALVGGKLEVRRLVVLIQDVDDEVGVDGEGVTVVLLGLGERERETVTVAPIFQSWLKTFLGSIWDKRNLQFGPRRS